MASDFVGSRIGDMLKLMPGFVGNYPG